MTRKILILISALFFCLPLLGQERSSEPKDSVVRLLSAKKARNVDNDRELVRIIEGPARFLHNDTYLICDTAYWYVDRDYMDAIGNVQIIQKKTLLTGDKLHYIINEDLAQFRGGLVELKDKDGNVLRTNNLDYNTKDSIGTYFSGASMMDKDSTFIESEGGIYESKKSLFTFVNDVEMISDTSFFISDTIKYFSKPELVHFSNNTKGWQQKNFILSDGGSYDKNKEIVTFINDVYAQTETEELWCDSLMYEQGNERAELYQGIQMYAMKDNTFVLGDTLTYNTKPQRSGEVWGNPIIISVTEEEGVRNSDGTPKTDSLFMGADIFRFSEKKMCDIDSLEIEIAKERRELLLVDPMENIKAKQREARAQAEEARNQKMGGPKRMQAADSVAVGTADSLGVAGVADSLGVAGVADSLGVAGVTDSLGVSDSLSVVEPDTTLVNFVNAIRNVRIFKKDMQVKCDSLVYTGLDSIARFYKRPILWNQIKTQLTSDSIQVLIENGQLSKGNLLTNAFMATLEDSVHYHQVKSPELIGYFEEGKLSRFDAIGGFTAKFFIKEKELISTMNHKEGKIMSATLKNEELQRILYLENIKSDSSPLFVLKSSELYINGFEWRGEERPVDRFSITSRQVRASQRSVKYQNHFPTFKVSKKYFDFFPTKVVDAFEKATFEDR